MAITSYLILLDCFREGIEDPLDDFSSLGQQMEQLSVIGRCDYEQTCRLLLQAFDSSASAYRLAITEADPIEHRIQEGLNISGKL